MGVLPVFVLHVCMIMVSCAAVPALAVPRVLALLAATNLLVCAILSQLPPPIEYALEEMIPYMQPDEMAEVTPNALRLRKQVLDSNDRKKATKTK